MCQDWLLRIALPKGADVEHWVTSDGRDPSIDPARRNAVRAEALLMLGLPGTAFIYQGDEFDCLRILIYGLWTCKTRYGNGPGIDSKGVTVAVCPALEQ